RRICVAYPGMERFFPAEKIVLTGNPVRKDILSADEKRPDALAHFNLRSDVPTLLVIGGSLGAGTLNRAMRAAVDRLKNEPLQVIWQTGKTQYDECWRAVQTAAAENIRVMAFVGEMDLAYATADVVVSRAGALSISELCLAGKPAILVPSPNVAEDHQTQNAQALVQENAALLVKDGEASEKLVETALNLLSNPEQCQYLAANIRRLGRPDAAERIADEVLALARQ
nr:UDP-N-acetylglucosamine--N-acetylmuramyl-(pentapeptide) pyrophosphoryl-undecaprenol N-acetylglucosamine transferase [Cytophagales bacterium]